MKEQLGKLRARIDELSLRERGLLFLSAVLVLYLVWQSLLLAPLEAEQKKVLMQLNDLRKETATLEQQARAVIQRRDQDPNAENQRRLEQLKARVLSLDSRISGTVHGLVEPREMARVLERVLIQKTDLELVRMESLGARPLLGEREQGSEAEAVGIYRHGLRMELKGKYFSTLDYLRALQALPWVLYWDKVELTMEKYPQARVVIEVHTLSLSEGFLGV